LLAALYPSGPKILSGRPKRNTPASICVPLNIWKFWRDEALSLVPKSCIVSMVPFSQEIKSYHQRIADFGNVEIQLPRRTT